MAMRVFTMAAAGHPANGGAVMCIQDRSDENCSILLKPMDEPELEVYERLSTTYADDPVHSFVPAFHGVQHASASSERAFIRLSNLLDGLKQPKVMDVKLGMRTYLQCETQNTTPRKDLFQKMKNNFPSQLTSAELDMQSVTKSRYMTMRDAQSTSASLGYRVSGTAGCNDGPGIISDHRATLSEHRGAALREFHFFAHNASTDDVKPSKVAQMLLEQLYGLRLALEASTFVKEHECIGTSVLLVIDASTCACRASWIDFAKTSVCKDAKGLCHREVLSAETQEEGLLLGLDNLIRDWETVAEHLEAETRPLATTTSVQRSGKSCIAALQAWKHVASACLHGLWRNAGMKFDRQRLCTNSLAATRTLSFESPSVPCCKVIGGRFTCSPHSYTMPPEAEPNEVSLCFEA